MQKKKRDYAQISDIDLKINIGNNINQQIRQCETNDQIQKTAYKSENQTEMETRMPKYW